MSTESIRRFLQEGNLKPLFIEELGWDHLRIPPLLVELDDQSITITMTPLAQKRGMVALLCPAINGALADASQRKIIEKRITQLYYEHLIVFVNADQSEQVWQWVKRELGKPSAYREYRFHRSQPGESLIQKLQGMSFTLEEEENITLTDVTGRVRMTFDVEKVTKRFYDYFKKEHDTFLSFISGIPDQEELRWYTSVMLNRLMFTYFIQKKGFLDNNTDYLKTKLAEYTGKDTYYREFLCPLFFEGFAKRPHERTADIAHKLGMVPYLNGGLFLRHQIEEQYGDAIRIKNSAFVELFRFFDQYQWHLDERPLRQDNEINPDVLGYIFEKYINQKQMGAYYTKEDITGYISQNTIIPFLFDTVQQAYPQAFTGDQSVWQLLRDNPDRYFYDAVKHGVEHPLPAAIAAGIDDVAQRAEWNTPADAVYALPTEIWREVVARRTRYDEVRATMLNGDISSINDFVTYNLDIRQFAQDVIDHTDDPTLLQAFWDALQRITVLDPTAGSGAFLFAALDILEALYEACLERMQRFVDDSVSPQAFVDVLNHTKQHPNTRYFILKSIMVKNLFGVDIMEEAGEICKLRLSLKLVAQVENVHNLEPLPDIDFNIRTGNTLVGFATYDEVKQAIMNPTGESPKLFLTSEDKATLTAIEEKAQAINELFTQFRQRQTQVGGDVSVTQKHALQKKLGELADELNRYLAREYSIDRKKDKEYQAWLTGHQPFHWFVEFYGIMQQGGFDVIIGNPPYVEYSKVRSSYYIRNYETESCGNLYAFVVERNCALLYKTGRTGMIIPHSAICTDRMVPVQKEFEKAYQYWVSTYCIRPAKLFVGVDQRLAIYLLQYSSNNDEKAERTVFSSRYHHWYENTRPFLLPLVQYTNVQTMTFSGSIPKAHDAIEQMLWGKLKEFDPISKVLSKPQTLHKVYFHNAPRYWIRAMNFTPYFWNERDGEKVSSHVKSLSLAQKTDSYIVCAILNSTLFYWWFILLSNCRDLVLREIENFPVGLTNMSDAHKQVLQSLTDKLMQDLKKNAYRKETIYKATGKVVYDEFYPRHSKPIIDEIDRVLAQHYGFTDEELDFILNYDIKYRMGKDAGGD